MNDFDIAVIGGGPAGMAAALAAEAIIAPLPTFSPPPLSTLRAPLRPLPLRPLPLRPLPLRVALIERAPELGGILNQCTHTGFGLTYFGEELTGQEYAKRFTGLIDSSGVEVFCGTMVLDVDEDRVLTLSGKKTGLVRMRAKAVILASGCRERPIGSLPVAGSRPSGVYSAGMAQKMMNLGGYDLGKRFIILGSGDVGMIVARHLAQAGKEVIAVVEKEAQCGGLERNRINCLERYGIPLLTETTVSRVHGVGRISGVTLTDTFGVRGVTHADTSSVRGVTLADSPGGRSATLADTPGGSGRFVRCDTLITSVGLIPERELLEGLMAPVPEPGTGSGASQNRRGRTAIHFDDSGSAPKKLPDWLFLCGNACYVHDVVDDVTAESERAGIYAAEFVIRGEADNSRQPVDDTNALVSTHTAPLAGPQTVLCIACPKGCAPVLTPSGWQGLACGRDAPVFQ